MPVISCYDINVYWIIQSLDMLGPGNLQSKISTFSAVDWILLKRVYYCYQLSDNSWQEALLDENTGWGGGV